MPLEEPTRTTDVSALIEGILFDGKKPPWPIPPHKCLECQRVFTPERYLGQSFCTKECRRKCWLRGTTPDRMESIVYRLYRLWGVKQFVKRRWQDAVVIAAIPCSLMASFILKHGKLPKCAACYGRGWKPNNHCESKREWCARCEGTGI